MTVHRLKLVYDGLDAADHHMPQSLERQVAEGLQIFAGAQVSYFVEGRVPDRIMDRTKYYQLHDFRQRPACWIAEMDISIVPDILVYGYFLRHVAQGIVKEIVGDAAKDIIRQALRDFFVGSIRDWKARRLITHPEFERVEPVLSMPSVNVPVFDDHVQQEEQKRRLYARMNYAMAKITAPIHRAATHVDIWFDDVRLDHIDQRFYSDEEIMEALLPLKEYGAQGYRYS